MGYYDFGNAKEEYVLTGYYYPHLTELPSDERYAVNYDIINPRRVAFQNVIQNIPVQSAEMAIRTNTQLAYMSNAYFQAQDGRFFRISEIVINPVLKAGKSALRIFKKNVQTEYIIRMTEFEYDGGTVR